MLTSLNSPPHEKDTTMTTLSSHSVLSMAAHDTREMGPCLSRTPPLAPFTRDMNALSMSPSSSSSSSSSLGAGHFQTVQMTEESDKGLFGRLQEANAQLLHQHSIGSVLEQIERQNALLEKDPKSICIQSNELRTHFTTIRRLVEDSLACSPCDRILPVEDNHKKKDVVMEQDVNDNMVKNEEQIDWHFWQAVIQDVDGVARKLPHLLAAKLQNGIPVRIRGLIWQAMCKSSSLNLETVYGQLCRERSPYDRVIQRDLARTFPSIDMFKQDNGPGQLAMRRILEAYSLYDVEVGYCQGLAFLVGPLLLNMPESKAFCVFVRMMETYGMRTMFTKSMQGLQLRLYQFSRLLADELPSVAAHMERHGVYAAMYASQWFLTLFAYTFPIGLVMHVYDIVFAEGAAETIMRVALAMLKRSLNDILAANEFEDLLDIVASRKLCEPYVDNVGAVIRDAMAFSTVVTRQRLDVLVAEYANEGEQEKHRAQQAFAHRFSFWKRQRTPKSGHRRPGTTRQHARTFSLTEETSVDALRQRLQKLEIEFQRTKDELLEVKINKQDVESERDALKLTMMELERCYATGGYTLDRSLSATTDDRNATLLKDDEASHGSHNSSQDDLFSSSDASVDTVTTSSAAEDMDIEELTAELVRVKVDKFELEQKCEKLTQDLHDLGERFDMAQQGLVVMIERTTEIMGKKENAREDTPICRRRHSTGDIAAQLEPGVIPVTQDVLQTTKNGRGKAGTIRSTSLSGRVWQALSHRNHSQAKSRFRYSR